MIALGKWKVCNFQVSDMGKFKKTRQMEDVLQPGDDERRNVLLRVVNSVSFSRAPRLKEFLLYVGTRALDGRLDEINERHIGILVFGRGQDFSPAEDNIVRTMARALRVKLKEYFEGQGRDERWRIEIPKGTYTPVFKEAPPNPAAMGGKLPLRYALLVIVLCGLGFALAWFGWRVYNAQQSSIFTALMGKSPALTIVCSDSFYAQYQSRGGQIASLEDYVTGRIFGENAPSGSDARVAALWPEINTMLVSHQADLGAAMRLLHSLGNRAKVELRHPRTLRMSDFKAGGDFLLLAGYRANPWVSLFEANLGYQMVFPSAAGLAEVRNLNPKAGEQNSYLTVLNEKQTGKAYARIGLRPGLAGKGHVLLVAGSTGQATDAAGDILLNPESLEEVQRRLGRKLTERMPKLDILIETSIVGGSARDCRILAVQ